MRKPRIGLLPLYIELYDTALPDARLPFEEFYASIAAALEKRGLEVVQAPVCRLRDEFRAAVDSFAAQQADAIVTLHLAYSPSLESAAILADTPLPIIVLDTTPTYEFNARQHPDAIMLNHGIHGVQDLCNLLIRLGKPFQIEAGHWQHSDVLDRVVTWAVSAQIAGNLRTARVGRVGEAFAGMGDFAVPEETLRATLGMEVITGAPATLSALLPAADAPEVAAEMAEDARRFHLAEIDPEAHRQTTRACLAIRRWLEQERLSAFTVNFLVCNQASGLPTMPFLEASKAMARGIGYAGEGDVLTAALVGALAQVYPDTTFTEMFCPDWENGTVFVSHMGELNVALAVGGAQLLVKPFPWTDAADPVTAVGRLRGGKAVLVNLAPGPNDRYTLVLAPVMMEDVAGDDRMAETVHGWFTPALPLADFLAAYSEVGGTHHSALVYGDSLVELAGVAALLGWELAILDEEWS